MQACKIFSRAFPGKIFSALSLALLLLLWSQPGLGESRTQPQILPLTALVIESAEGPHHFEVMVAKNRAQRLKGLMFRRRMDGDQGMLFDYQRPREAAMWMKNTYISLDMIFIDRT